MYCTRSRALLGTGRWHLHGRRLASHDLVGVVPRPSFIRPYRSSLPTLLKSVPRPPQYPQPYPQPHFQNGQQQYPQPQSYPTYTYAHPPPHPPRGRFLMGFFFGVVVLIVIAQLVKEPEELAELKRTKESIKVLQQAGVYNSAASGLDWKERPLDLHYASLKLRLGEISSTWVGKATVRTDAVSLPGNMHSEDYMTMSTIGTVKKNTIEGRRKSGWSFWAVYDGHAGAKTAQILEYTLIPHVVDELRLLSDAELESLASWEHDQAVLTSLASPEIDKAVKTAFLRLDDAIIFNALNALKDATSTTEALCHIAPARAGSCALLVMFDPQTFNLHVACTGDSRAVLGRCSATGDDNYGGWTAVPLSEDQTGFNESEVARITAEHPGEDEVIDRETGRLLGLAVTRAFGDCRWKWPAEALETCRDKLWGPKLRPNYQSPPYLTAEPVVMSTKVQKGDFLILASDGFWDNMSSEDAVKCVEMWYQARERGELGTTYQGMDKSRNNERLPEDWKATPADFVAEEHQVATHLVKNALGGSRRDLFRSVMCVEPPLARNVRDDISVQVIFFDGPAYSWISDEDKKKVALDKLENPERDSMIVTRGPNPFPNKEGVPR